MLSLSFSFVFICILCCSSHSQGGPDLLLWLACFLTTIIFGAVEGIVASIVLSLLWLLRKTVRPPCITLGRLPNTRIYRNISRFPMASEHPGIKIVRFDASLNFSNSDFFENRMRQKLLPGTRVLIVDGSSINDLDITAVRMLQRFCQYLQQRDTLLLFANWKGPMRDFLERAAFYQTLPPQLCFLSLQDAVYFAQAYIHHKCRPHLTQLVQMKDLQKETQVLLLPRHLMPSPSPAFFSLCFSPPRETPSPAAAVAAASNTPGLASMQQPALMAGLLPYRERCGFCCYDDG